MATITISSELDVADKYDALVLQSLGGNSIYARTKETLQELVADGAIDDTQKAEIISNIMGNIITSVTNASMSTALQWSQAEKEISLKKLELAHQLDILANDALIKAEQIEEITNKIRLAKVESKRMYGSATFDVNDNITNLADEGKIYEDILLTQAQELKVDSEKSLTDQKLQESYAAVHKIIADTYVNFGNYSYTGLSTAGLSTVTKNHGAHVTLSDTQQNIAKEQAKGYVYNAWANSLTGSASMLGTAIASDLVDFSAGSTGETLLNTVLDVAANLKAASSNDTGAVPAP